MSDEGEQMANGGNDPVWTELGNIDYLLDQFARAVERGEVSSEAYERFSPRYLERRIELVEIIERRARANAERSDRVSGPRRTIVSAAVITGAASGEQKYHQQSMH